jgi:transcriptional/translational regulatory protein YebC/TACO1
MGNNQTQEGLADAKRGQAFTKLIKEISVAAKMGGSDPDSNARLRAAILKHAQTICRKTISNARSKKVPAKWRIGLLQLTYEGYAPGGVALIIDTLTDNKNRTAADVRSTLTKLGGSLGAKVVFRIFSNEGNHHL